ncbi:MAG: hypothetical protein U0401_03520 [Anaerolineae bacterium]
MNTQHMQFNRQKVAALLLAGAILAAGLTWAEVSISQASRGADAVNADAADHQSGLLPQLHFNSVKGGNAGAGGGDHK